MKSCNVSNASLAYKNATLQLDSSMVRESDAILAYKDAILQLDSSIMYGIYENDLIFIIAIDDDKYDHYEKEINLISFEIHSKFDLEKEIVCMPKDFVSNWDKPFELIHSQINVEAITNYNYHQYSPNQTKGVTNGCAAA